MKARRRLSIGHPIMRAKADVLTNRDDGARRGPASGPAGARMEVASPLVGAHGLDGGINIVTKAALGLLPNDHIGTGAL